MSRGTQVVVLAHNGEPVTGAHVCVYTWMVGMSGMAMSDAGHDLGRGRYGLALQFEMSGEWRAAVTIRFPRGPVAAVPIDFHVVTATDWSP